MRSKRVTIGVLVALLLILRLGVAQAEEWPSRPITFVVHASPGGGLDVIVRLLVPYVERILGQKVIIVNKPAAGGEVAWTEIAHTRPDGYTWTSVYSPGVQGYTLMRKTGYSLDDFEPCAAMVTDPGVLVVNADSPFKTLKDFVEYAKQNPNTLTVGNSGTGSDDYIATRLFEKAAAISVKHVAYDGAAPVRSAVLGGHISAGAMNASEAKPYVDSGKLRVLGVMSEKRCDFLPSVATFREQGYDVIMGSVRGFVAPKGTPKEIVNKMAKAVEQAMQDPEFQDKARQAYQPLDFKGPEEFKKLLWDVDAQLREMYSQSPW